MRKNFIIDFKSSKIYLNLDFNRIKKQLKYYFDDWQDFNSIILIKYNLNINFTVDDLGELTIFRTANDKYNIKYIKKTVLKIMQEQIPSFKYK